MGSETLNTGFGTIAALLAVIAVSVWLGTQAQKAVERGSFMTGYFLGNRGLGAWALALTATVQSGGTFMGFPSLIYTHGWIVAVWIGSYMVVPITGFAVLGKRFAQLSRRTGAITVPDMFTARFDNRKVGLIASIFIMFFMSFLMVAQFKAGAIVMKLAWPGHSLALTEEVAVGGIDNAYLIGLAVFALTVVGYTLIGGFLASVWTDMFQSILMVVGVVALFCLVVPLTDTAAMRQLTTNAIDHSGPEFASGPGFATDGRQFLPIGLAISYFFVWPFAGLGAPAGMVRVMACKDSGTMRRSLLLLSYYNLLIYLPLVVIFVAARSLMPDLQNSDEVMPRLALWSTQGFFGGSLLGGLILAAPFGAVMATVSSYLVMIASGLVRDIYQGYLKPHATDRELRWLSHATMIGLGVIAVLANISPVNYLQSLIVFSGTSQAATFVAPAIMVAFWRRATAAGAASAMICGAVTMLGLSIPGWLGADPMIDQASRFRPYYLGGFHPVVFGLAASAIAGVVVSLLTKAPREELVARLFDAEPTG